MVLNLIETEEAIKYIKDQFEQLLAEKLALRRVSAPLFVLSNTGLNDQLNGVEKAVTFDAMSAQLEIVQSLAKWKRMALLRYKFNVHEGLYTDMNAIRKDEQLSNIHSYYVDQWDWEKIITKNERTESYLMHTVNQIYEVIKEVEKHVAYRYHMTPTSLPDCITFIDSQTLEDKYPNLSPKEREYAITKTHKAVFIMKIGWPLSSGSAHDSRSPDYDDWLLNGDLLLYHEPLDMALEMSSMGIRVDKDELINQLTQANALDRLGFPYHQSIINQTYPLTIGGGIGQSRLCMFYLKKRHIGEVQASYWPDDMQKQCEDANIQLL